MTTSLRPGSWVPRGDATLAELLSAFWRRRWVAAGIAAACTVGAVWSTRMAAPEYEARATIRLPDGSLPDGRPSGTDADIARLKRLRSRMSGFDDDRVLGRVVDRTGLRMAAASRGLPPITGLELALDPGETARVDLSFSADGVEASRGTASAAAAYGQPLVLPGLTFAVGARPAAARGAYRISTRDAAIDRLDGSLFATPVSGTDMVRIRYVAEESAAAARVIETAVEEFAAADAVRRVPGESLVLIDAAEASSAPLERDDGLRIAFGVLLGLLAGCAGAAMCDRWMPWRGEVA